MVSGQHTNWTPRELHVPLDFLGTGRYIAESIKMGQMRRLIPKHVTISRQTVHKGEQLTLHLASGGGCAIRFIPDNKK